MKIFRFSKNHPLYLLWIQRSNSQTASTAAPCGPLRRGQTYGPWTPWTAALPTERPPAINGLPTAPLIRGARPPNPTQLNAAHDFFFISCQGSGDRERGTRSRALTTTLRVMDNPKQVPACRRARKGRRPGGLGAACPLPRSAPRRGRDARGESETRSVYTPIRPPSGGSYIWYFAQRRATIS